MFFLGRKKKEKDPKKKEKDPKKVKAPGKKIAKPKAKKTKLLTKVKETSKKTIKKFQKIPKKVLKAKPKVEKVEIIEAEPVRPVRVFGPPPSYYKILDHTADIRVEVYGQDLPDLFVNAAKTLYDLMIEVPTGVQRRVITIDISANDLQQLLVKWLSELLYRFDVHDFVVTQFDIKELTEQHLVVECMGEKFYQTFLKVKTEVKAVTYHKIEITKGADRYTAKIVFDV